MHTLIHSPSDPDNPYLALARLRNSIRIDGVLVHKPDLKTDWGARMGNVLRKTGEFEVVEEKTLDLPIGYDPELGMANSICVFETGLGAT